MRVLGVVVLASILATAAHGQVVMLGAAGSISGELNPDSRPDEEWLGNTTIMPDLFVGFPILNDALVRLRALDLAHEQAVEGAVIDSRLRGVTIGVDYLLVSTFGRTVFSGGVGGYKLDLEGGGHPPDSEPWEFGWYVGIGEWFPMSKASRLTLELDYHNTAHPGRPQLLSLSVGMAFSF